MSARRIKALVLFLFVGLLLNLAGCSSGTRSKVEVAIANVPRAEPQVDQGLLEQQVAANNAFALDLYRSLRGQDGNLFYSPYSLSIALAMTYAGARGETEQQMRATLHYLLPQDQLHPVFNLLDRSLNTPANEDPGFQLSAANSLWGQKEFPFLPDYLDLIARNYGAGVRLVDFSAEKNREEARQKINKWVSQQTNDKIKDLLSKEMLDEDTVLVLANAVYFKGEWVDPFTSNSSISPFTLPFTLPDGQEVDVTMMNRGAMAPYFKGDGYQAVVLPYKGDRAEMVVVMPDPGNFTEFEQVFDQQLFDSLLAGLGNSYVELTIPKFNFEYSRDMKDDLAGMGMPVAFTDQADFTGMYDSTNLPPLAISHIAHKAFVAVDEKGTEAAAATDIIMIPMSGHLNTVILRIDHPFIFAIRDRQTGSLLFVGRVLDPRAH